MAKLPTDEQGRCLYCGHAAHQAQTCMATRQSGGASGMIQRCACGRGMVGDPDYQHRQEQP